MFTRFRTEGYNGYSLAFSPFFENKVACASAANFGIVGNGRLWILNHGAAPMVPPRPGMAPPPGGIMPERTFDTQDGLFDVAWSEMHENQLVTSSGDGSIKLWDLTLPDFPIQNWHEHAREVFSVNWNMVKKDTFVSGSWDHTIKLWNPQAPRSIRTYQEHTHCIYATIWNPYGPDIFASCSGDHTVKLWDAKMPRSAQTFRAHNNEILSLDWNKYRENSIVTASVDHTIKVWDLRFPERELMCLRGHEYAVRRVKCSPHDGNLVASASYDMTMRLWDISGKENAMIYVHDQHSEFVLGLDFNLYVEGQIATASWDQEIHMFTPPPLMRRR